MYDWLPANADDDTEIVAATNRLARDLRTGYHRNQLAQGHRAWRTPRILAWSSWLRVLLERSSQPALLPLRLEPSASALLWEQMLRSQAGERQLNSAGLVRQMQHAWQRLQDWCVPTSELLPSAESEDQRLFALVATAYEYELKLQGWIDNAQLPACATHLVASRHIPVTHRVLHAGFERLPPAAQQLFAAMQDAGCHVQAAPPADHCRQLELVAATDPDAELRAAGAWARARLEVSGSARIAIIYPSLERNALRTSRLVREGFAPGWQYNQALQNSVNVSYGRRLSEYPAIAIALLWLKWVHRDLDAREVSVLLRSPFTPGSVDDARSRFETRLRRLPDRFWSATDLAAALTGGNDSPHGSEWFRCLQQVMELQASSKGRMSPATWTDQVDAFLQRLGWPGGAPPDSAGFQLQNRWRELLNELSRLEAVRPLLGFSELLTRLSLVASETIYQPELADGVLQLLGPLEGAGLEFDHVWVANLESMQWPPASSPLPLVSRRLQRRTGMPDALPADTLDRARRILGRLAGSAGSVVLSWPASDGDTDLLPSPLLEGYRAQIPASFTDPGWFAAQLCDRNSLQRVAEDPAPPVIRSEKITGGAYTLQRQFDEPFSAFAYGRLGIKDLPMWEAGLAPSLRGRIIHQALAALFSGNPTSTSISAWPVAEREQRIDRAVHAALRVHDRHADAVLRRLLVLERDRLNALLSDFLSEELVRPGFTVAEVEFSLPLERHGVVLDLRVDRIDRLDDGSYLVVDYKTGAAKSFLDRNGDPVEWQLVLYAMALQRDVGGLVLINIDSRTIAYKGTGSSVPWNPMESEHWKERFNAWQQRVDHELARFAVGDVHIHVNLPRQQGRALNILSRVEELRHE